MTRLFVLGFSTVFSLLGLRVNEESLHFIRKPITHIPEFDLKGISRAREPRSTLEMFVQLLVGKAENDSSIRLHAL